MGRQPRRTVKASLPRSRSTWSSLLRPPTVTGRLGSPRTSEMINISAPRTAPAIQNPAGGVAEAGRTDASGVVATGVEDGATTGGEATSVAVVPGMGTGFGT